MKILHRYILGQMLRNVFVSLLTFVFLFIVVDFFDRIDNVIGEGAGVFTIILYFLYKIPFTLNAVLPIAVLVGTLFTLGLLSKNSELTAMRASGVTVFWIARPIILTGLVLSLLSILFNETVVPYAQRRTREIYNIDIRQKDKSGTYSQKDFWWRDGDNFYSVSMFDSRNNTLLNVSKLTIDQESFRVRERTNSGSAKWIDQNLGWSMQNVKALSFSEAESSEEINSRIKTENYKTLPLQIKEQPKDFYDAETDPHTMSFNQLSSFINKLRQAGIPVSGYMADLYAKISFPFVIAIISLIAIPFSLRPARSGSMALSVIAAIIIAFSYYAVHSFSLAMGRAELWPAFLAAWMANIIIGLVALVLNLGAESPH